jgi:hypothetical protein
MANASNSLSSLRQGIGAPPGASFFMFYGRTVAICILMCVNTFPTQKGEEKVFTRFSVISTKKYDEEKP